ncbi:MAG: HypC/HybG/HupF family hydrogenase formation chaperone [Chromatiales bacterium]|nr:HypC/HybG/HupF family hydrogenase formation chaperone [Chromatiales bacterium]
MCIGVPVQIIENREFTALCRGRNGEEEVNMMLIGPQEEGTWILNFLGSAREVLTEDDAEKINAALDALAAVMSGDEHVDIDSFFPDITNAGVGTN